jgi:hypothetical protein
MPTEKKPKGAAPETPQMAAGTAPRAMRETVREWKDRCEVREREERARYIDSLNRIVQNTQFMRANSTNKGLVLFAEVIERMAKNGLGEGGAQ